MNQEDTEVQDADWLDDQQSFKSEPDAVDEVPDHSHDQWHSLGSEIRQRRYLVALALAAVLVAAQLWVLF
ncbi:hypothetical protein BH23CHL5_BH23CHL5_08950 [soil metagenome]